MNTFFLYLLVALFGVGLVFFVDLIASYRRRPKPVPPSEKVLYYPTSLCDPGFEDIRDPDLYISTGTSFGCHYSRCRQCQTARSVDPELNDGYIIRQCDCRLAPEDPDYVRPKLSLSVSSRRLYYGSHQPHKRPQSFRRSPYSAMTALPPAPEQPPVQSLPAPTHPSCDPGSSNDLSSCSSSSSD